MYTEKEKFAKSGKKNPLHIKEQNGGKKNVSSEEVQVFKEKNSAVIDTHREWTVCNDKNVPEHTRVRTENNVLGKRATEIGISRNSCKMDAVMHETEDILSDMNAIDGPMKGIRKKSKTPKGKLATTEHKRKNMEDGSKNTKGKSCITRTINQNNKIRNRLRNKIVQIHPSEIEESEIDEPERQETLKTGSKMEGEDHTSDDAVVATKKRKQRIFECQTCNQKFAARWEFKIHLSEHPTGNILQCKPCQKVFNKPYIMQNHLQTHTGARPLQCGTCGMSFRGLQTLRKHEHIHLGNKEFECEVCNKTFSRKQYLQEHKRTHTGSKPYVCDVCHKSFVGKTGLNHHKKTHKTADEKKCAVCEICGKSFTRHSLWTHMKHHSKEHKCEHCSKCFATTTALHSHVAGVHLGHSLHHCNTCGKGFIRKFHLSRHIKTHEQRNNIVSFACSQCPSKFKGERLLHLHVKRNHTDHSSKSQKCGICGKHFETQSTLLYHQRLHFHDRPHRCNLCGKSCALPYQLRDHIRLHHSEEKLFPCSVCKKKLATQSSLNKHLLVHRPKFTTKGKSLGSFQCSSCSKIFPTGTALSNHSRKHFSKPYQCTVCRKAYRYEDSLLKHLRVHSNPSPTSEATATKELPCIYTIQVCRPSFALINSGVDNDTYTNEQASNELPGTSRVAGPVMEADSGLCPVNTYKTADDIALLELRPIEETYLNHTLPQTIEYTSLPSMDTNSICDVPVEKSPDMTSLPRRPYSITIDGNLCCNSTLSTDEYITPPITLLPERSDLQISNMDVGMTMPSHVLLPVTPCSGPVELSQLSVPLPPDEVVHEFHDNLTKDFSL